MCGIAGISNSKAGPNQIRAALEAMNAAQVHRGPDEGGVLVKAALGAGLASRRLSIIDVEGGQQPVSNEDATVHAVLNGEIYNHVSLREQLEAKGHRFLSRCDTEVIVHAYEQWGESFVEHLDGMFGLAVLDGRDGRLLIARDGPGMKPLYFAQTPHGLLFASEIKAILATGWISPEVDPEGIDSFLTISYVAPPRTMFRDVRKLAAGCLLVANAGSVREKRYWQFRYDNEAPRKTDEEYVEEFDSILSAAVRSHLAADVPVGALLSGGWDSSLVTAFAAREAGARMKTFSIIFPESPQMDESRFSRLMAQELETEHHEIEFRASDLPALLPALCRHIEQPLLTAPAGVVYQLASLVSGHVKTTIGGEGADELFGGYEWMRINWPYHLRRVVPRWLPRTLLRWETNFRRRRGLHVLAAPTDAAADAEWSRVMGRHEKREILKSEYWPEGPGVQPAQLPATIAETCVDSIQRRLAGDFNARLSNGILHMQDKLTMAHSLELRLPFLDRSVVEFAARLPSRMKIRGGREKVIVGGLARRYLPPTIAARRKKGLGYPAGTPANKRFRAFARELLLDSAPSGPFDRRRLESTMRRWARDEARGGRLFRAVFLQAWWNEFLG
jgi:asparagine synthase (glutamine-hydrolysing)